MQTPVEDRKKTVVLLAIIVVVLIFAFKMGTKQYADATVTYAPPPVTTLSVEQPIVATGSSKAPLVDPFWRPISLPVVHSAAVVGPQILTAGVTTGPVAEPTVVVAHAATAPNLQDLELQGIVSDSTSVAIVRVGDAVHYLSAGSDIDALTRLVRVLPGSIEILQGKSKTRIVLGQTLVRHEAQPGPPAVHEPSAGPPPAKSPTSVYNSHE